MNCPECNKEISTPDNKMVELYKNGNKKIAVHCVDCDIKFVTHIRVIPAKVELKVEGYDIFNGEYEEISEIVEETEVEVEIPTEKADGVVEKESENEDTNEEN